MVKKKADRPVKIMEAMMGGPGRGILTEIGTLEETMGNARLFSTITLEPGSGIGPHNHVGECELFCIISGTGIYLDDDTEVTLTAGDVAVLEEGHRHSIRNEGPEDLVFVALIPLKR